MICFLRRERRCFAVNGAGAGVLAVWCIAGAVFGVKASVGCLTLANEIPFMTRLRCSQERLWIQQIPASVDDVTRVCQFGAISAVASANLVNRPRRVLRNQ